MCWRQSFHPPSCATPPQTSWQRVKAMRLICCQEGQIHTGRFPMHSGISPKCWMSDMASPPTGPNG